LSPKVKKSKRQSKEEAPQVSEPVIAVKQSKKRRDSFIPMPARRKSVCFSSVQQSLEPDDNAFSDNKPVAKPPSITSRRMSVGGLNRFAPVAPQSAALPPAYEEKREVETKKPSSRRMSFAVGMQENVDPQQGQGNIFSKGLKYISQSLKSGANAKVDPQDECESKNSAPKKSKPLQPMVANNSGTVVDDITKNVRTSGRRKSIAAVSGSNGARGVELWKDI